MRFNNPNFQLDKQTYKKFVEKPMNALNNSKKPDPSRWWFFGWGLALGATLMGSILTIMQVVKP